jgi:Protein of unknown function (DUF1566)
MKTSQWRTAKTVGTSTPMRPTIAWMAALLVAVAACHSGDDRSGAPAAGAGDRFVMVGDGVVFDPRTGLQWTSRDHDRALPWDEADRHCRELAMGSRTDWRLPQIEELRALFDTRFTEPCGDRSCHLDPAIRMGGPYVWSASSPGPGARFYFDLAYANSLAPSIGPKLVRRVLCVRRAS